MKAEKNHVIDVVFMLALLCVFTVCGLMVVFIGINVYKDTANNMESSYSERTALAYVAKQIRQNDQTNTIEISEIEGVTALVFNESKSGQDFCKYIYYYNGYLQEIYTIKSFVPVLTAGQEIIEIGGFDAEITQDGMIEITINQDDADDLSLTLALQSENALG